jgi:hypothetical protein
VRVRWLWRILQVHKTREASFRDSFSESKLLH